MKINWRTALEIVELNGKHLGSWQTDVLAGWASVRSLKGAAKNFSDRYMLSFHSLVEILKLVGIKVVEKYGPRGGRHYGIEELIWVGI